MALKQAGLPLKPYGARRQELTVQIEAVKAEVAAEFGVTPKSPPETAKYLTGVERDAERLFVYVCAHPGCTRAEALGVVPSEAGWDDLLACSDIELVAMVPDGSAGAYSAVRLIHARDAIMKTLRAAHGAWVTVRELREATPYSNGFRAAAIKTLGGIEHDGKNRYRKAPRMNICTHPESWPCTDDQDCRSQKAVDARIALETGTATTDFPPRIESPGVEYEVEIEESPVADESTVEFWREAKKREKSTGD
ncbi:hypothetical protein P3F83_23555 [Mycobacteroides immunogenum]|uniref:hypothetical protein n=1 Tax=Mycobacteroides immunogenum TaxID=83262 RepID=UPI0025B74C42|nr:hypothetical protein [Mycobacteroides immunogenum]WJR33388.1 hypothetical protein P3F83_23555 [Mycobacteroides immunogenum]